MCPLSYKTAFSLLETPFFGVLFLKTAYIEPILRFHMKQLCSYLYLCEVGGIALLLSLITASQIFNRERDLKNSPFCGIMDVSKSHL